MKKTIPTNMSDDEIVSKEEAMQELQELRGRSRGGQSMFAPLLDKLEEMGESDVLTRTVDGYGRVSNLRNFLKNNAEGPFVVKSAKTDGQENVDQSEAEYKVFIFRSDP